MPETRSQDNSFIVFPHQDVLPVGSIVKGKHEAAVDAEDHLPERFVGMFAPDAGLMFQIVDIINSLYIKWNVPPGFHDAQCPVPFINDAFQRNNSGIANCDLLHLPSPSWIPYDSIIISEKHKKANGIFREKCE